MDFDTEPTAFNEYMTVRVDPTDTRILSTTNNGFAAADPTVASPSLGAAGTFTDFGPKDQGAMFDINATNTLFPAAGANFTLYYGVAGDTASATAALAAVGAKSYAMAKPATATPPTGAPNTFMFGYKGPA